MLFLGCLFDREKEEKYLKKSKVGLSNAVNTFQWNLIDGFLCALKSQLKIVNILPVGIFPLQYKELFLSDVNWEYNGVMCKEIGCVNLPFIKQYNRYRRCLKLLKKSTDKEIIIYSAYYPFLRAISKLDNTYTITLIVPDLPEFYDYGKTGKIKTFFRRRNNLKIERCMGRIDNFVLLTEQMKEPLKTGNRPYVVVEGICGLAQDIEVPSIDADEKIILYTGTLHKKFGIDNLLKAFSKIKDEDYRLWICGGGDMKQEIEQMSVVDKRISFFGYLTKAQISKLQQQATVLVNPRQNNEEFTKYSFPSKTMEYMASGKPVVMYKLDGIPDEYDDYLYYVSDNSVETLKDTLISVCEQPKEQRMAFGNKARNFVLREKNGKVQVEKILKLLQ